MNAVFAGSLDAFAPAAAAAGVIRATRVCVVATAAAFRGPDEAVEQVRSLLAATGATISAVSAIDRASAIDSSTVAEVRSADVVILVEGAALHARSVWRRTALGDALNEATLLCVGTTGSVLGATMIDPRGGAPTTGLGFFDDVVLSVPAGPEQTQRTRELAGESLLVELGRRSVVAFDGRWRVVVGDDLVVTRAGRAASLSD